ncbi:MAG: hypothetical protein ACKV2V_12155 [Blastocatellia bacterium]
MNCRDFDLIVLELAREEDSSTSAHTHAQAHATSCASCAARLARERALWLGARAVNETIAGQQAPPRVEAALLTAFRAQQEKRRGDGARGRQRAWLWPWRFATAIAAAALVVFFIGMALRQSAPETPEQTTVPAPTTRPVQPPETIADNIVAKAGGPRPARRSVLRRVTRPAPVAAPEEAAPFYLLNAESAILPLESGRIVRVEVPASALIPYGLAPTAEMMRQPVQADLLLGQDGLARAIRLLPMEQNQRTQ